MSVSKFESLPNEILTDIIENYINGMDTLMAFNYQLNQRFTALINQCHRLRFNFTQCRKNDFSFCMGLLPAYVDKIEELRLSEKDTPGQIHAFLSFFPSFLSFKRLRTLYLHLDAKTVQQRMVEDALRSLYFTNVINLSIETINADDSFSSGPGFIRIFRSTSLIRLYLSINKISVDWKVLSNMSSNIKYLTIPGKHFQLQHLQFILQWAPRLKYLNIGLMNDYFSSYQISNQISKKNIIPKSTLRTLILSFGDEDQTTLNMLAPYLSSIPDLNRLEIIATRKLLDGNMWELFLETSLPALKYLTLWTTTSRLPGVDTRNLLESFQNSFWLFRENFNLIITNHQSNTFNLFDDSGRDTLDQYDFNPVVVGCEIAPVRAINNSISMLKDITVLKISGECDITRCFHYFENVKCLIVDTMNKTILKWMTKYVNCQRITELNITVLFKDIQVLDLLLTSLPCINSLHTSVDLVINKKHIFDKKIHCLKRLAISTTEHVFNEKVIDIIAQRFPYIEHLQINTEDIHNVPVLKTSLPHLHNLTVDISRDYPAKYNNYGRQEWEYELSLKNKFFFQCKENSLTIWMDEGAYEQPFWTQYVQTPSQSTATATTTAVADNTRKKKKFPFFRWFN